MHPEILFKSLFFFLILMINSKGIISQFFQDFYKIENVLENFEIKVFYATFNKIENLFIKNVMCIIVEMT